MNRPKKAFQLRIDAKTFDALQVWADDELRSLNAQIEYLIRDALRKSGVFLAIVTLSGPADRKPRPPVAESLRTAVLSSLDDLFSAHLDSRHWCSLLRSRYDVPHGRLRDTHRTNGQNVCR